MTRRAGGWVGGNPQTHLLGFEVLRLRRGLYRVGDSISLGQSATAVALGGLRVAQFALAEVAQSSILLGFSRRLMVGAA